MELGENPDIEKLESGKEEVLRTVAELTGFELANVRKMLDDKKQFEINAFSGVNLPERAAQIYMIETWRHEGQSARKANKKKMDKLKDELKTEFDPIKTALKDQIKDKISEDNYFIQFQDLEEDKDFLQEVKYFLSNPALIGEESIEKYPSPVFVDNEPFEAATHYIARIVMTSYATAGVYPMHVRY